MIEVIDLVKRYGAAPAVSGISFSVAKGEVVGFLGPNGAGKSTTLRILAGCLAPTGGTARLGGLDAREHGLEVRAQVGYLPENNPLYEDLETAEYLEWCARVRGLSGARLTGRVRAVVEACALGEALRKPLGLLSRGFRQRAGLAAAIVHDPAILLLDEPTAGLDPNQAREVRGLVAGLKAEKTVLLSTHILSEVEAVCDRVVILDKGRIAASGTPAELARRAGGAARVWVTLAAEGLDRDAARAALAALPGAAGAEAAAGAPGEARFTLSADADLRAEAFRLAAARGWTLLELRREEASLEELFRQLAEGGA